MSGVRDIANEVMKHMCLADGPQTDVVLYSEPVAGSHLMDGDDDIRSEYCILYGETRHGLFHYVVEMVSHIYVLEGPDELSGFIRRDGQKQCLVTTTDGELALDVFLSNVIEKAQHSRIYRRFRGVPREQFVCEAHVESSNKNVLVARAEARESLMDSPVLRRAVKMVKSIKTVDVNIRDEEHVVTKRARLDSL